MRCHNRVSDRRGAAGLWSLVLLAASFSAAALVLVPARLTPARAEAQTAADAAALAAAAELLENPAAAPATADWYARANAGPAAVALGTWTPAGGFAPGRGGNAVRVVVQCGAARAGATAVAEWACDGFHPTPDAPAPLAPFALPVAAWDAGVAGVMTVPIDALVPLRFGRDWVRETAAGLTAADLADSDGRLMFPAAVPVRTDADRDEVLAALADLRDRAVPRAWPLTTGVDVQTGTATLTRPAGARVVAVGRAGVTLRPCVVITSTAVSGIGGGRAVAKIRLVD